ncbi:MbtH family NRPS accessory protein [Streptomyces sp. NPDC002766]|jgi:MbtH protein|uniref:MbtH family protein n=1 Tax=unclassified Streptomyces TaxID=2593676 RepID=UPI00332916D9
MVNPFDAEDGVFHVLVNDEMQHAIWPAFVEVPDGWSMVLESADRDSCLNYVNAHWTDMRPKSLVELEMRSR